MFCLVLWENYDKNKGPGINLLDFGIRHELGQ